MIYIKRVILLFLAVIYLAPASLFAAVNIPIFCYHNFNPTRPGSMNMTPQKFESHLKWLKDNGYTVISLREAVEFLQGKRESIPDKAVVITADDGWESVQTYMLPIVKKYNIPVTLFIYPQTISTGKNTLTWDELKALESTGLFEVQSHTYSHPNFKVMKRRLSATAYEKFVQKELVSAKKILEEKMGHPVTLLAWPFGIYNTYLEDQAAKAGYEMAFTIDARTAVRTDGAMAQPRFMMLQGQSMDLFMGIAKQSANKPKKIQALNQ
jgi:peptidoglycan/xylan/chitin deacetylase (PgdA/CDA1 family)